jgi:antirestriction protein
MIRHIVVWKLSATDAAAREQATVEVERAFAGLADVIPEVRALRIERNVVHNDVNWDIALVSDFDSAEDLAAYQVNPDHRVAAAVVTARVSSRASIDYEF